MTATLTETASTRPLPSITIPVDGEGASVASILAAIQQLANRSRLFDAELASTGVGRLAQVADITALKGIAPADRGTKDVRVVPAKGLYRFDAAGADAEALPWVVAPTTGTGRWYHELFGVAGAGALLATVSGGKLVEPVAYQTIATAYAEYDGSLSDNIGTRTANTYADAGAEVSLTGVAIGDVLIAHVHFRCVMSAAAAAGYVRLVHEQNSTVTAFAETETPCGREGAEDKPVSLAFTVRKVVAASFSPATNHFIKVQFKSNGADTAYVRKNAALTLIHMRP